MYNRSKKLAGVGAFLHFFARMTAVCERVRKAAFNAPKYRRQNDDGANNWRDQSTTLAALMLFTLLIYYIIFTLKYISARIFIVRSWIVLCFAFALGALFIMYQERQASTQFFSVCAPREQANWINQRAAAGRRCPAESCFAVCASLFCAQRSLVPNNALVWRRMAAVTIVHGEHRLPKNSQTPIVSRSNHLNNILSVLIFI